MFIPAYQRALETGKLEQKAAALIKHLSKCDLCPRKCDVNRMAGDVGICGVARKARISSYGPHHGEEDPLRGMHGSGTIFFSGCNLNCLYCQNADISQKITGIEVSARELANIMLDLQRSGCHNINLVSPTHVVPQIVEAVYLAALSGLNLPLVYNTGGYDALPTLLLLEGIIDIYMPDMKYSDDKTGYDLSGIPLYPDVNQAAVMEMHRQVGDLELSPEGIALRGLLVRHLVLPQGLSGSQKILTFLADRISLNTYLNIMDQYRPAHKAHQKIEIGRRLKEMEFKDVVRFAERLGFLRLDKRY